jgi:hypothetical protein
MSGTATVSARTCVTVDARVRHGRAVPDGNTIYIDWFTWCYPQVSSFFLNKEQEHCQIMLEEKESSVLQLIYYMNKKHKL